MAKEVKAAKTPAEEAEAIMKMRRDLVRDLGAQQSLVDTQIGEAVRALVARSGEVSRAGILAELQERMDAQKGGAKYDPSMDPLRALLENAIKALQTASAAPPPAAASARKPSRPTSKPVR